MREISANLFRQQLKSAVDEVIHEHNVLRVNRRKGGDFVVMSVDDWQSIEETLYLNRVPGLAESIQKSAKESLTQGTALKDLDW